MAGGCSFYAEKSGQQTERTVHPGVVAERSQRELRVLAGVEHVRAEMALDALQQVVARAGHAAAEDDALRVADAAGVRQRLAQIVEHLLERFDREGVAAAGGVEHVLAGKVPHRTQFVLARVLGLETEDLAGIDSFDALIRFLLQSPATEDVKWICTALFYSIDDYMEELDIILRKATALFLEHVPDTAASLCRSAMKDAKAKIGDDPVALFVNLSLPQRPERLTVVPSMMAFHGVQWDFAAETLYYGVYYTQLGELIVKYSDQSASLVRRLKSIGDKSRLEILRAVKDGPCNGQDIAEKLSLAPATISHHMNLLCNEGLLTATRRGTSLYYEPDCENLSRFLRELEHYLL